MLNKIGSIGFMWLADESSLSNLLPTGQRSVLLASHSTTQISSYNAAYIDHVTLHTVTI